jgi:hypothetical protein
MSEIDSCKSHEFDDSSDQDNASVYEGQFINDRGDRHSEESSGYHISAQADPNSTNKKYVYRTNNFLEKPKKMRVEFFPTNMTPNSPIKHAISGAFQYADSQYFRVGTRDEDLFFTMILATGELSGVSPVLFYDNPEQYERHFFTKLSQSIKDRWTEKRDAAISNIKSQKKLLADENKSGVIVVK